MYDPVKNRNFGHNKQCVTIIKDKNIPPQTTGKCRNSHLKLNIISVVCTRYFHGISTHTISYGMMREQFSITTVTLDEGGASTEVPTVGIQFEGSPDVLRDRLEDDEGSIIDESDIDVGFRKQNQNAGVLSVAERLSGMFVLESNADVSDIDSIVEAAESSDERYQIEITAGDEQWTFEKGTLLVYDKNGQLLKSSSLIPGSVEL